jgi:hypothetical protein
MYGVVVAYNQPGHLRDVYHDIVSLLTLSSAVTDTGPLAHVLAVRPWHRSSFSAASHTIFLSSFFRFDVLV